VSETKEDKWYLVGKTADIPFREGRRVQFQDHDLAIFNLGDKFCAIDSTCPHKQGPLADGIVAGNAVFCPLHNLKMNLDTGCAFQEGEGQVNVYPVKVIDGKLYVAIGHG
jgi:nitrite reductase (NADH) small subunit